MVQVIKDPIGTKGARLSTQISIAGRLLVFLPQDDHMGVSQKIPPAQRESCVRACRLLAGETGGGFILRTNGEDASDAELAEDIAYLRKAWARIKDASVRQPLVLAAPGPEPAAAGAARPGGCATQPSASTRVNSSMP
jgi:ribonuclease G